MDSEYIESLANAQTKHKHMSLSNKLLATLAQEASYNMREYIH